MGTSPFKWVHTKMSFPHEEKYVFLEVVYTKLHAKEWCNTFFRDSLLLFGMFLSFNSSLTGTGFD